MWPLKFGHNICLVETQSYDKRCYGRPKDDVVRPDYLVAQYRLRNGLFRPFTQLTIYLFSILAWCMPNSNVPIVVLRARRRRATLDRTLKKESLTFLECELTSHSAHCLECFYPVCRFILTWRSTAACYCSVYKTGHYLFYTRIAAIDSCMMRGESMTSRHVTSCQSRDQVTGRLESFETSH